MMIRIIRATRALLLGCVLLLPGTALAQSPTWDLVVCEDPGRLPYSNRDRTGLNDRIAALIAEVVGARLSFVSVPMDNLTAVKQQYLWTGVCDVLIGISDLEEGVVTSAVYLITPYVYVKRSDNPLLPEELTPENLAGLRIGVQDFGATPHQFLVANGLAENVVIKRIESFSDPDRLGREVQDVAIGLTDVALLSGPVGGYFGARSQGKLDVEAVTPEIQPPMFLMFESFVIGVRPGDEALRDTINIALAQRWDDIQQVLEDFDIPQLPVARLRVP